MKRVFDLFLILTSLPIFLPMVVILALTVRMKLGSPVRFKQIRPGKNGRPFEMFKFRTMRDATNDRGGVLPDSERITQFGAFLRRSSLDELPEFWNVLKGDMSLIGPRPLLMEYL